MLAEKGGRPVVHNPAHLAGQVTADLTLSPGDKKVIDAFTEKRKADNNKFYTDGKILDGLWMGGNGIATWKGDSIVLGNPSSKAIITVHRFLRKSVPDNWLKTAGVPEHLSRFEEGVPADPTENMSPEDAKKWKEENEKNRDKFKTASLPRLSISEVNVATKMYGLGYRYAAQFSTIDGPFGTPLYFKKANDVGPFMRGFPAYKKLKMDWTAPLEDILGVSKTADLGDPGSRLPGDPTDMKSDITP